MATYEDFIANISEPTYKVYQQYQGSQAMLDFFDALKAEVTQNYINTIKDYLAAINIRESENEYLIFYAYYFLGVARPMSSSSEDGETTMYDWTTEYDKNHQYDFQNLTASLSFDLFLKYLRFIYDYRQESLTIDMVIKLLLDFGSDLEDILSITLEPQSPVTFNIAVTTANSAIYNLLMNYRNTIGLPPNCTLRLALAS